MIIDGHGQGDPPRPQGRDPRARATPSASSPSSTRRPATRPSSPRPTWSSSCSVSASSRGIIDEVPGFARKLLAGMASASASRRSRRLAQPVSPVSSSSASPNRACRFRPMRRPEAASGRPRRRRRSSRSARSRRASLPAITRLARRLADRSARCSSTSRPRSNGRVLRRRRDDAARRARGSRRCASATTSGAGPTTAARTEEQRQPAHRATSAPASGCSTLLRDPAAGHHALVHLLRLPRPVHRHRDPRDRPPAARLAEVPARRHLPGVLGRSPTSPAWCSWSASSGRSAAATSQRPYRIRIKTKPEDAVILGTFLVIGAHRLLHRGASASRSSGRPAFEKWSFVGYPLVGPVRRAGRPSTLRDAHRWLWVVHVVAFLAFLVILPTTKLRHMITSPMNMYLQDTDRPKGAMKPMPNLMETELETFGAVDDRGLHLEAAVRHRRVHDLRALHVGVPGARDRQAARPARDRAEGRRGDGRDRRPRRCRRRSASTATSRSPPTACSSASRPRSCGRARSARRATRSAR